MPCNDCSILVRAKKRRLSFYVQNRPPVSYRDPGGLPGVVAYSRRHQSPQDQEGMGRAARSTL